MGAFLINAFNAWLCSNGSWSCCSHTITLKLDKNSVNELRNIYRDDRVFLLLVGNDMSLLGDSIYPLRSRIYQRSSVRFKV